MRINFRPAPVVLLAGFLLLGGGCKKSEPLYPVTGKVMLGKNKVTEGIVTFVPDESKGNKSKFSPTGKIESDGTYTLMTDGKPGAPAGWYKVIVNTETPGMSATTPGETPGKAAPLNPTQGPKIDPKYKDVAKTPITKEVVASGAGSDHYDVTVQ